MLAKELETNGFLNEAVALRLIIALSTTER